MPLNAKLHIQTVVKGGRTILKNAFCTQPFKVADITEDRTQQSLRLMLMSASPGILDGDAYALQVDLGEGSVVAVETQSFQRLFHMQNGASQHMTVTLQKGSSFCYLPHPVVPHRQARFRAKSRVFLEEGCTLLWGEVISCGRKRNNEVFKFSSYHSVTEVFLKGKLVVKENILLRPSETDLAAIGQLEGYTHQATLLFLDETAAMDKVAGTWLELLGSNGQVSFGVSTLPVNGILVRILGNKAEQLFQLIKTIAATVQEPASNQIQNREAYVS